MQSLSPCLSVSAAAGIITASQAEVERVARNFAVEKNGITGAEAESCRVFFWCELLCVCVCVCVKEKERERERVRSSICE